MEYSLSYLLDIVSAFVFGMWIMNKIIFYKIRKALEEAGVDVEEEEKVEVIQIKKYFIEKINELFYLYEFTSNKFIGQGKSLEELAIIAKDQSEIAGVKYNEQVIWFVNGEVKTII